MFSFEADSAGLVAPIGHGLFEVGFVDQQAISLFGNVQGVVDGLLYPFPLNDVGIAWFTALVPKTTVNCCLPCLRALCQV